MVDIAPIRAGRRSRSSFIDDLTCKMPVARRFDMKSARNRMC